ncbi:sterol desaturase [Pandoraea thiooxydans]|uniref:Sterol desaturase n=2 Tax=Pandoraea thiooxydans TaxID=445709 RepID=A0A0G3EY65_9BURK|nr:sterol desaturase [Pandoraea thiooxydans]
MNQAAVRLLTFLSLLALLAMAEYRWPQHAASPMRQRRWPVNFGLGAINVLCLRLLLPWLAVDAAFWARQKDFGLLHLLHVAPWAAAAIAFVALDLTIYTQHRLMHRIEILWRLHRVHHTDIALDVSSGVRFHPLEILLSMGIKIVAVLLLGASPAAVAAFEIVLSSFSLITHANLRLSSRLDAALRWVFVTPDMHRIHHSVRPEAHDTNYGFHISWWDRLFGSYLPQPQLAQDTMPLGLTIFREDQAQGLAALLIQPAKQWH